jgi:hypothetical protein
MHLEGMLIEDQLGDTVFYAGDMKVRITDWFFMKKNAELKYIGLENALIKFQRTDSVWRQQFLMDFFSTPSAGSAPKKKAGIRFNLKKLEMRNVTFLKKDAWNGDDLAIQVGTLNLDADKLSLSGNLFEVNSLAIQNPVIALNKYTGRRPPNNITTGEEVDEIGQPVSWNKGNTIVKIDNLKITNGIFKADKQGREPLAHFDGKHILFTGINGEWAQASFTGDTIMAKMKLAAKERCGFEVKNMTADVKMTPQGMAFSNMEIITNRSVLRNYYSMSYDDLTDMDDYIHKVKMAAVFEDSYVDSDDIAFFAPALGSWKKNIVLKGKIRGTVDDLSGREMMVQAGNGTMLDGDISMTGLPDINKTFIDFKSNDFRTTYPDAVAIVPALRSITSPDLRKIQYLRFKGNFTGFIRDFVTFGTVETNLGSLTSDLNMKLPAGQEPVYSGNLASDNFKLGELLGNRRLGNISFSAKLKGTGFRSKTRNTTIDGAMYYLDFNKYRYHNIAVDGRLEKNMFEGVASVKDENADLLLNGVIDLNNKSPRIRLLAGVEKADLLRLRLLNDSIQFSGNADLDMTTLSLDNFQGIAKITGAEIKRNGRKLAFDSLIVTGGFSNGIKTLSVSSNEFRGTIAGQYSLTKLPFVFTYFLNKYYPAYVKAPQQVPENQSFSFDIETYYADEYLQLVHPSLSGFNNTRLNGKLDLSQNFLQLSAEAPQFSFKGYGFNDISIKASGNADSLVLTGQTDHIRINDSLSIQQALFRINSRNDTSKVSVLTGANRQVEKAELHALVLTYNDGVKIEFDPSTFTINSKTWTIDEEGELVFRSNTPAAGLLSLSDGEQKILFKTQPSYRGNWNDIKVELNHLNLADFAPYFMPKNRLEGLLSGNIHIEDPTNNLKIISENLQTKFLRLDNDSLGEVKASVVYDDKSGELKAKGNTLNQENYLGFDASIFIRDKDKRKNNLIALHAKKFQINVLERFLGNLFSDMQGYLTGDIDLAGEFNNLSVTGKGRLNNAGLKVNFTRCYYKILDTDIELTPYEINLDGIVLKDTVTGNPIYLTGGIEHQSFKKMFYNLDISTRKPGTQDDANNRPVQLLNTTYKDNKQFYGSVKGTGSLSLLGPQSNMYMKIDAIASEEDSSNITLPPSASRESGIADFLVERKYGREMEVGEVEGSTNIIYDVDLTVNKSPKPMVSVRVILDELTGDEIKGKGSGSLNIRSGTTEPLLLRGRFDIEEGLYVFTFQSFFQKPFVLRKGSENFIEWNGDPYDANVRFSAVYTAERVSFAPLRDFLPVNSRAAGARENVYVVASLSDKLFKPAINFSLDFPGTSVAVNDPELALVVQQMQRNVNEINRQVTYLIVFNSFAPVTSGTGTANSTINEFVYSSVSSILFNEVSKVINSAFARLFNTDNIGLNISGSLYNRNLLQNGNSFNPNQGQLDINIPISLFKDRFLIKVGSTLDLALDGGPAVQEALRLLPDVTLEWLISESGSIRASFFYRENNDYLVASSSGAPGRARRIGANLSYRKDFDRLVDIFKRKRKKGKATETPSPPSGTVEIMPQDARKENE